MSNKQQLQINNTALDNIITKVNSIKETASSLPESGGNTSIEESLINRTISSYTNNNLTKIGSYAFYYCKELTNISFPKCSYIGLNAFYICDKLESINFPECERIDVGAFRGCSSLKNVTFPKCVYIGRDAFNGGNLLSISSADFPVCKTIDEYAFAKCSNLTFASFPACTVINTYAFSGCYELSRIFLPQCTNLSGSFIFGYCSKLKEIYLGASTVCNLQYSDIFYGTSIYKGTGLIFVPASLVDSYKTARNWSNYSSRIFSYTF